MARCGFMCSTISEWRGQVKFAIQLAILVNARRQPRTHCAAKAKTPLASDLQKLIKAGSLVLMLLVSLVVSVETTNTPVGGTRGRNPECRTTPRRLKFTCVLGNGGVFEYPLLELPTQLQAEQVGASQATFLKK